MASCSTPKPRELLLGIPSAPGQPTRRHLLTLPLNVCIPPLSANWSPCLPALLSPTHSTDQSSATSMSLKYQPCSPLQVIKVQFVRSCTAPQLHTSQWRQSTCQPSHVPCSLHVDMPILISIFACADSLFLKCSSSPTLPFKLPLIPQNPPQMPLALWHYLTFPLLGKVNHSFSCRSRNTLS